MARFVGLLGKVGEGALEWKQYLDLAFAAMIVAELSMVDALLSVSRELPFQRLFLGWCCAIFLPMPWLLLQRGRASFESVLKGFGAEEQVINQFRKSMAYVSYMTYVVIFACALFLDHIVTR